MQSYSPAWPHGDIKEIFPNIFFVTGSNVTNFNGVELQHSRNMIIVREKQKLSLINTVRLDEKGLAALDALGHVENIVRIGAFHGRDDAFYLDRFQAKLWALKGMQNDNSRPADIELIPDGQMPFAACSLFVFETSTYPEGILHIAQEKKGSGIHLTQLKAAVITSGQFNYFLDRKDMPRPLRKEYQDAWYHVMNRGGGYRDII